MDTQWPKAARPSSGSPAGSARLRPSLLLFAIIALIALSFFAGRRSVSPVATPRAPAEAGPTRLAATVAAPVLSDPPATSAAVWPESAWHALIAQPGSLIRNARLAQMLEAIAARDPPRAVALVEGETNLLLREQFRQAALRGWARVAPADAARWALTVRDPGAHEAALKALFVGAVAGNPATAVELARTLSAQDAGDALSYGDHVIDALCDAGLFQTAAGMAASSGDASQRSSWLGGAYSRWAEQQPQAAAQAAQDLTDPALRDCALHGVIGGWSRADPAAATQFVLQLPDAPENSSLLSQALERWTKVDLKSASDWINNRDPSEALDAGVAAVATRDYLAPDVAVGWAESVVDPTLRSETLTSVLRTWATNDLPAAQRYFASTQNLLPDDRKEIAALLATLSGPPNG